MSSAGISRTGQGTKRAEAFCIAYVSRRSNKDGWLGYPLTTSFQKWNTAVCKIQANEERHLQQMRATLINTIPRSCKTVSVSASKLVADFRDEGRRRSFPPPLFWVEDVLILVFEMNSLECPSSPNTQKIQRTSTSFLNVNVFKNKQTRNSLFNQ